METILLYVPLFCLFFSVYLIKNKGGVSREEICLHREQIKMFKGVSLKNIDHPT